MRTKRRNTSERTQLVIVHAAMVTALVAIVMVIQTFASVSEARANRSVASTETAILGETLYIENSKDVPSCEELKSQNIHFIESDDTYEITTEELCNE